MKRKFIYSVFLIFFIFLSVLFLIFRENIVNLYAEKQINTLIESSKFCMVDSDCVLLSSKCPFDCYISVNKNHSKLIQEKIESFDSNCVYGCIMCSSSKCIDNVCVSYCDDGRLY